MGEVTPAVQVGQKTKQNPENTRGCQAPRAVQPFTHPTPPEGAALLPSAPPHHASSRLKAPFLCHPRPQPPPPPPRGPVSSPPSFRLPRAATPGAGTPHKLGRAGAVIPHPPRMAAGRRDIAPVGQKGVIWPQTRLGEGRGGEAGTGSPARGRGDEEGAVSAPPARCWMGARYLPGWLPSSRSLSAAV